MSVRCRHDRVRVKMPPAYDLWAVICDICDDYQIVTRKALHEAFYDTAPTLRGPRHTDPLVIDLARHYWRSDDRSRDRWSRETLGV